MVNAWQVNDIKTEVRSDKDTWNMSGETTCSVLLQRGRDIQVLRV